jgi:hypothetical protein
MIASLNLFRDLPDGDSEMVRVTVEARTRGEGRWQRTEIVSAVSSSGEVLDLTDGEHEQLIGKLINAYA